MSKSVIRKRARERTAVMSRHGRSRGLIRPVRSQILAVVLVLGLMLAMAGGSLFAVAELTNSVPEFDQQIMLDDRHLLVIHGGPRLTCPFIPNPQQPDCFRPGSEPEFSIDYLTPQGARSLAWFRLP
jgi:hypothetical protein